MIHSSGRTCEDGQIVEDFHQKDIAAIRQVSNLCSAHCHRECHQTGSVLWTIWLMFVCDSTSKPSSLFLVTCSSLGLKSHKSKKTKTVTPNWWSLISSLSSMAKGRQQKGESARTARRGSTSNSVQNTWQSCVSLLWDSCARAHGCVTVGLSIFWVQIKHIQLPAALDRKPQIMFVFQFTSMVPVQNSLQPVLVNCWKNWTEINSARFV